MARHLTLFCLLLFVVNFSVGFPVDETKATDGENGTYFLEGDIMVPKYKRNGNPNLSQRWPNGIIPYIIDRSVDVCKDDYDYECKKWETLDECTKNPSFMLRRCPIACGVCGTDPSVPTCKKYDQESCDDLVSIDACTKHVDRMRDICPEACGFCKSTTGRTHLQNAFKYFRDNTCIRLVPRTTQRDYVVFKRPSTGCNSFVGKTGGAQTINLASECPYGTVLHEIMHAIGFEHEMCREDRDDYITVHWENIIDEYKDAFKIKKGLLTYGTTYDTTSIMQYPADTFSKNGQYTITPKFGQPSQLKLRSKLSDTDLLRVWSMYNFY